MKKLVVRCLLFVSTISVICTACAQTGMARPSIQSQETATIKQKLSETVQSLQWEQSGFEIFELRGSQKTAVNTLDFLAVYPTENGIYPEYPEIGLLDYSTADKNIITAITTTGKSCIEGTLDDNFFFPDNLNSLSYYTPFLSTLTEYKSFLYGTPYITADDSFECDLLFIKEDETICITFFYLHSGNGWYVDALIQGRTNDES